MAPIHPELVERIIKPIRDASVKPMDVPIEERRAQAKGAWLPQDQQEPVAQVIDQTVDDFSVQLYVPEGEGPFPVCMYYHGGGFVFGSVGGSAPLARKIANRTPCIVVNVEYALSPEVRYPVASEQCYRAVQWTFDHIAKFGGDPARIAVAGDSAGGCLAAGVALMARDRSGPPLVFQLLFYPNASYDLGESEDRWLLTPESLEWYYNHYFATPEAANDPYAIPANYPSVNDLPPAFFLFAEHDPLTKGGLQFLDRLQKAGVAAVGRVYEGMMHGAFSFAHDVKMVDDALNEGIQHLREEFEV